MKKIRYRNIIMVLLGIAILTGTSCQDKYSEYNTNPDAVTDVQPEVLFTKAVTNWHDDSFDAFYDHYRVIGRWNRQFVGVAGNGLTITDPAGNINNRYSRFFNRSGNLLVDVQKTIEKMPADQRARYAKIGAVAEVLKVYEAWYVTDANGSIPFSEAMQARYGGTTTPVYETQQQLYDNFDKRLKDAVAILKSTIPGEAAFGQGGRNDLYFQGNMTKWVKAANALRLKIASRLIKRDLNKARTVILEVLGNPADLMDSPNDDWCLKATTNFIGTGNWDIRASGAYGANGTVDFMWRNGDPRLKLFYRPNSWTQANFDAAKAQGRIPAGAVYDTRRYYGQFTSPDAATSTNPAIRAFFTPVIITSGTSNVTLDTVSQVQNRMFAPALDNGTGIRTFMVISYADICLLRAEFAARGITTEIASEWYNKGIDASIATYDRIAKDAILEDYTALVPADVTAYKARTEIAYNPATGLQQIAAQQYLNYYHDYNEAWALLKRTGMPNATTTLKIEDFVVGGQVQQMPRRFVVTPPLAGDPNFTNKDKAIKEMMQDPSFGIPSNVYGRVWWDMP